MKLRGNVRKDVPHCRWEEQVAISKLRRGRKARLSLVTRVVGSTKIGSKKEEWMEKSGCNRAAEGTRKWMSRGNRACYLVSVRRWRHCPPGELRSCSKAPGWRVALTSDPICPDECRTLPTSRAAPPSSSSSCFRPRNDCIFSTAELHRAADFTRHVRRRR